MTSLLKNIHPYPLGADARKITPPDFKNVTQLPDSHAWTTDHRTLDPAIKYELPTVDLEDANAAKLVRRACEEWGAFYITNHGVPMSLLHEMEHQTRRLFELPTEVKMRTLRLPGEINGYGTVPVSENYPKQLWSEGFTIAGPPSVQVSKLWPQDHTEFCAVAEKYQEEMERVRKKVMAVVISSLGLTHEDIDCLRHTNIKTESQVLHLNSYPACPDPTRAIGLAPHSDSSFITLIHQGDISGLQVLGENFGWVPMHPVTGALTVFMGDMMHILTNGRFRSPMHRVVVDNTRHRVSVVYFYLPSMGVKVSPVVKDGGPIYRAVTWEELVHIKTIQLKDTNPLQAIRLI